MQLARPRCVAVALTSLVLAVSARAQVTIDFNDLPSGTLVTNQYPEATVSSSTGSGNFAHGFVRDNILCTGPLVGAVDCIRDTYIDFTTPVSGLRFMAIEPNCACVDAQFRIFENGIHTATVDLVGLGGSGNKPVDLSAYTNVTRLEIVNILDSPSENGIGWDDFQFTPGDACANEVTAYCTAKENSNGCLPQLAFTGPDPISVVGAGAGDVAMLSVSNLSPRPSASGHLGQLFYSTNGAASTPFFGGTLCMMPPIQRIPPLQPTRGTVGSTTLCDSTFGQDFNARIASGIDPALVAGATAWVQGWARDTAALLGVQLSDALTFTICP